MNRRGFSLVELTVSLVLGVALLASVAPVFMLAGRGMEQQLVGEQVQTGIHLATLHLMRGVQGASAVAEGSSDTLLLLEGGPLAIPCGGSPYWVGAGADGLGCGPEGGPLRRNLAATVGTLTFEYGLDSSGDGVVDAFQSGVSPGEGEDVMAVRFLMTSAGTEGRGQALAGTEFVVVLRSAVLSRVELAS